MHKETWKPNSCYDKESCIMCRIDCGCQRAFLRDVTKKICQSSLLFFSHVGCGEGCISGSVHILHLARVHMLHLDNKKRGDIKPVSRHGATLAFNWDRVYVQMRTWKYSLSFSSVFGLHHSLRNISCSLDGNCYTMFWLVTNSPCVLCVLCFVLGRAVSCGFSELFCFAGNRFLLYRKQHWSKQRSKLKPK